MTILTILRSIFERTKTLQGRYMIDVEENARKPKEREKSVVDKSLGRLYGRNAVALLAEVLGNPYGKL